MTEEEVCNYQAYAATVYRRSRGAWYCRYDGIEDFIQSFLLCSLEHEKLSKACIFHALKYSLMSPSESVPYKLESMAHFSDLIPDGADYDSDCLERFIPCSYEMFFEVSDEHTVLKKIAVYLYPKRPDLQEAFLDFLFGATFSRCEAHRKRNIRLKIFSHRLDILKFLWQGGLLSTFDYRRYKAFASELTKLPLLSKPLSMNSATVRWRKWAARQRAKRGTV